MFDKIAASLLKEFFTPVPVGPPRELRLEIPRSHPKAAALVELAQRLAQEQILESGIRIKKLARPGAMEEILDFVEKEFGVSQEQIRAELSLGQTASKMPTPDEILGRVLPLLRG